MVAAEKHSLSSPDSRAAESLANTIEPETQHPSVYAVIINWNGEKDTIVCLDSLMKLDYGNLHLVISDNGSRKESLDAIERWFRTNVDGRVGPCAIASYAIIKNGRNLGFTGANTVGINYALDNWATYVLLLNNDTIVTPTFLTDMVEQLEATPDAGIAGCKIFYADADFSGRHKIWSLGGYRLRWGMPINSASGQHDRREWRGVRGQQLVNGCCMLIKRSVIDSIGVQDDRLFFGMDDVEYSFRAHERGWKNIVVRDAVIYHAASQSVVPNSGLQVYYLFRNVLLFRYRSFKWYQNIIFSISFFVRYVAIGSTYRYLVGRGRVNRGVFYALLDFFTGITGECPHTDVLKPQARKR